MNFSQSISACLSKYATFRGRASRSEFWWFILFYSLLSSAAQIFDGVFLASGAIPFLSMCITFILTLPTLAVMVRRLHDTGRSGWWYFINSTIIGIPFFFYWMGKKGDLAKNKYDTD